MKRKLILIALLSTFAFGLYGCSSEEIVEDIISSISSTQEDESDKDESDKDESDKDESDKDESDKGESDKDESDKDESDEDESDKDESYKDEYDEDESDKDEFDKDESDKDEFDKDEYDEDESDKDEPDKDEYDKDEFDKDESDKDESVDMNAVPQSDDLYSFEAVIDGKYYKLPMLVSEFEKSGWKLSDKAKDIKLEPNKYIIEYLNKDGKKLMVGIINGSKNVLGTKECYIGGFEVDNSYSDSDSEIKITLPKGITIGSTKEDLISAYGEPSDSYDVSSAEILTYKIESYKEIEFNISTETNKVKKIEMMNFIDIPEDDNITVSTERVESKIYTAPKELGEDILSFNVKYDGVLCKVPVPFYVLEEDGWVIARAPEDVISAKSTIFGFTLRKGNQTLKAALYNEHDTAMSPKNCLVTNLISDNFDSKFEIELPKGIKIGSTKEEVEEAYSNLNPEIFDSNTYIGYTYRLESLQEINILVKKETNKVYKIEVKFIP